MKPFNRIISLLMVLLMLITSVPYENIQVSAASDEEENYTLTLENTYEDSFAASNSAAGGISFFGDTEFNGCYGNQLTGVAKELYDSIVDYYATNKNTGEYTHTFEAPFTFNAEISGNSIVMNDELEEISLTINYAMQVAMDAFLYDHPEVFWLRIVSSSYSMSASGNSVDGYIGTISDITITPTEIYSGASSKISQYDEAVNAAISAITVTESRYDTLKNVHDYICNNAYYNLIDDYCVHSSEAFFIGDGGVVCEGYAKAFKVLCDELEIPCVLVSGDAGGAHMWNYVQMDDDKWYLIDATWDDQESMIYDTYFLANANTVGFNDVVISEERTEKTDFSGTGYFSFTYPVLSTTAYTVHIHEWDTEYTVDVDPTCTEKGSKSIHCVVEGCMAQKDITEIDISDEHNYENYICTRCGGYDEDNLISHGSCGESVYYTLDNDGNMRIFGEGEMYDYGCYYDDFYGIYYTTAPWDSKPPFASKRGSIKSIEFDGVTSIGDYAFYKCTNLERVIIPNSVTHIGECVFEYCSSIENIMIPNSVTDIGGWAFGHCANLESVIISNGIERIGAYAFAYCTTLKSINIPESVTAIGGYTFYDCSNLECIIVDENNGYYANDDFGVLFDKEKTILLCFPQKIKTTEYIIPYGVTSIETYAFGYGCNITSIILPESITHIADRAFDWDGESFDLVHYLGTSPDWSKIEKGVHNYYLTGATRHYCSKIENVDATCTTYGNEVGWYCSDCEKYVIGGETISKLGHSFDTNYTIDKEPTCTTKGSKSQHCTRDGCTTQTNITSIPATNHPSTTEYAQQDATCSENGYTLGVYCSDCEEWIEGHEEIPALTHSWSEGVINPVSTCKTHGTKTYTCQNDATHQYTEQVALNSNNHEGGTYLKDIVDATCTSDGYTGDTYCSGCNAKLTLGEVLDALTHDMSTWSKINNGTHSKSCERESCTYTETENCSYTDWSIIKESTCTSMGTKSRACTVCGCVETAIIETVTHTPETAVTENRVEPKCEVKGSYDEVVYCSICDTELSRTAIEIPALTHSWDEGIINPISTCKTHGTKTYTCLNDTTHQYTEQVALDSNNHEGGTYLKDKSDATCTTDGYTGDIYCFGCDTKLSSGEVMPSTAHKNKYSVVEQSSTCTETGYTAGTYCPDCETWLEGHEIIEKTEHTFTTYTSDNNATCVKDGTKTAFCDVCKTAKNTIADEESKYNAEHEYTVRAGSSATCIEEGERIYVCDICEEATYTEIIPALGHSYSSTYTVDKAATCTTEGSKSKHCTRDGCTAKTSVTAIAKLAHTNKTTTAKATLSKNGKAVTACTVCGNVSKTTTIYYPKTITLSTASYTYNGKTKTPSVTVKDSKGKTLKKNTDYTVKYESGRKVPGKYTVTITFKGNYTGTKKLYFTIAPKVTSKITATQTTSTITLKWNKVTGADGYRVYKYNSKTKKYEKIKTTTGTSLKISKLKAGTAYKYKVRAYTKDDGTIWGGYSSVFETATKPKTPTLKVSSTSKGKATFSWTNVSGESGYQVYYSTKKDSGFKKDKAYKTNIVKGSKSKLKSGKKYYFKVRAYKKTASGTVYSSWSSVKSVKIK